MSESLNALRTSVTALANLVDGLEPEALTRSAYPTEWTIADTLSHLGSGAVIMTAVLGWTLEGTPTPDGFMNGVWDEWNAKEPVDQARDLLAADRTFLEALEAVSEADAVRLRIAMGDLDIDFATFVQHRLDEHVVHSWDVHVALDPDATLLDAAVPAVLDGLAWAAGVAGRPIAEERTVIVHTFDPPRVLRLELGPDAVMLEPESRPDRRLAELHLPAEALVRLVYGRLDVDHVPHGVGGTADLDELRGIFPGF